MERQCQAIRTRASTLEQSDDKVKEDGRVGGQDSRCRDVWNIWIPRLQERREGDVGCWSGKSKKGDSTSRLRFFGWSADEDLRRRNGQDFMRIYGLGCDGWQQHFPEFYRMTLCVSYSSLMASHDWRLAEPYL